MATRQFYGPRITSLAASPNRAKPTIQVRDVPQDAYDVIVARAKANGQSIQQYMRAMITDVAAKPTKAEAIASIRANLKKHGSRVTTADILEALDAGRR